MVSKLETLKTEVEELKEAEEELRRTEKELKETRRYKEAELKKLRLQKQLSSRARMERKPPNVIWVLWTTPSVFKISGAATPLARTSCS